MKTAKNLNQQAKIVFVVAFGLSALGSVALAQVFTDRAAFQVALDAFDTDTQTFESVPLIGTTSAGSVLSLSLPGFTVSATPTAVKVLGTDDGFGSHNTTPGGSRFLYLDTGAGFTGSKATFQFSSPVYAIGFDYTGVTELFTTFTASIASQTLYLTVNSGPTDSRFWGFIGATPFSSLILDSGKESGYGIDQVTFAVVPEPNSLFLLAVGLCSITAFVRRTENAKHETNAAA